MLGRRPSYHRPVDLYVLGFPISLNLPMRFFLPHPMCLPSSIPFLESETTIEWVRWSISAAQSWGRPESFFDPVLYTSRLILAQLIFATIVVCLWPCFDVRVGLPSRHGSEVMGLHVPWLPVYSSFVTWLPSFSASSISFPVDVFRGTQARFCALRNSFRTQWYSFAFGLQFAKEAHSGSMRNVI